MRFVEMVLLNPFFNLAVAVVLVVIAPKLNSQAETVLLVSSGLLIAVSIFRTTPVSDQALLPRILITLSISAIVGLVLCFVGGWRPILGTKPPDFMALANNVEYPSGTNLADISWSSRFGDTRLIVIGTVDYSDIDITIRPNVPVAAVGQISNLSDVAFAPVSDPFFTQQLIVGATGQRISNPLVLVSTSAGYRLRCKTLPHDQKMELVIATADIVDFPVAGKVVVPRSDGGIFGREYVLKIDETNNQTKLTSSNWYGHGKDAKGRIEEVYKIERRLPTSIEIEGSAKVGEEKVNIKRTVEVQDLIGTWLEKKHL